MENGGTKAQIFAQAALLFADYGYNYISMKEIAEKVGIRPSSIYNHYESKDALLDQMYALYKERCLLPRLSIEACEPILQTGTAEEILEIFNYPLAEPQLEMFAITRILWARKYIDATAREIYNTYVMEAGLNYISEVFARGAAMGRIQNTQEELKNLGLLVLAARIFSASAVVTDPNQEKWRIEETEMLRALAKLLKLKDI